MKIDPFIKSSLGLFYLMHSILEAGSDRPQTVPFSVSKVLPIKIALLGFADGDGVEWLLQ